MLSFCIWVSVDMDPGSFELNTLAVDARGATDDEERSERDGAGSDEVGVGSGGDEGIWKGRTIWSGVGPADVEEGCGVVDSVSNECVVEAERHEDALDLKHGRRIRNVFQLFDLET